MDLATTSREYRRGGGGRTSELVTLIANGLWTGTRRFKAGISDTPLCPHCGIDDDLEHILWHCPRWERACSQIPEQCAQRVAGSNSARLCAHCQECYPHHIKQQWPAYQQALAQIVGEYQQEHLQQQERGARTVDDLVGGAPTSLDAEKTPIAAVRDATLAARHTPYLVVTALIPRERAGTRWPFSDVSLQRWIRFVGTLRCSSPGLPHQHPYPSILELLFAYMRASGGGRFVTDIAEDEGGGRLAIQLDCITRAIVAWQRLAGLAYPMLVEKKAEQRHVEWHKQWGYPSAVALALPILIPDWGGVRLDMYEFARNQTVRTADSRAWRAWTPGTPGSQSSNSESNLLSHTPLWDGARRLSCKRFPPPYDAERREIAPFVAHLKAHPASKTWCHGTQLWKVWRTAGVVSPATLAQFKKNHGMLIRRLDTCVRLLSHYDSRAPVHIPSDVSLGLRFTCCACGKSSPNHQSLRWLQQTCLIPDATAAKAAMERLQRDAATAMHAVQATALVA